MPTSFTTNLRLSKPADGDTGWGSTVNNGFTDLTDSAITGTTSVDVTSGNVTLTVANGAADQSRQMFVVATGTPGTARDVIVPSTSKLYFVKNDANAPVTFKVSGQTGVSIPAGRAAVLRVDGTDVVAAVTHLTALTLASALSIASGGTGVTATPTNGQLLIGNGAGFSLATLTAGFGITITNGSGAITLAASGETYSGAPVTVVADYTVATGVSNIINNKTGSSLVLTLPTPGSFTGREITVQNYQNQTVVSVASNVVPRAGGSAGTAILDAVAGNWASLVSDGTNWVIMRAAAYNNLLLE